MITDFIRYFWVRVYKDDTGFYPAGKFQQISCNHQKEDTMGITTVGEIVSLPGATLPPGTSYGNSIQTGAALVPQATIFDSTTQFADASYKTVIRVKDFTNNNVTSWVDATDYNTNVVNCNSSTHN